MKFYEINVLDLRLVFENDDHEGQRQVEETRKLTKSDKDCADQGFACRSSFVFFVIFSVTSCVFRPKNTSCQV